MQQWHWVQTDKELKKYKMAAVKILVLQPKNYNRLYFSFTRYALFLADQWFSVCLWHSLCPCCWFQFESQ